jgi:hypothetical protein
MSDLFDTPELIPPHIREIFDKLGEDADYPDLENALQQCEAHGYTFDYYLDAQPYDLRIIDLLTTLNP